MVKSEITHMHKKKIFKKSVIILTPLMRMRLIR